MDELEKLAQQWATKVVAGPAKVDEKPVVDVLDMSIEVHKRTLRRLPIATETPIPGRMEDDVRPRTRGDCASMERPCPYVSCRYHLYLDANPKTGTISIAHPDLEVWEMIDTCALDVADEGEVTLEQVGLIYGLTRERIRQIETTAFTKLEKRLAHLVEGDGYGSVVKRRRPVLNSRRSMSMAGKVDDRDDQDEDEEEEEEEG